MDVKMVEWILKNKKILYYNTSGTRSKTTRRINCEDSEIQFIDIAIARKEQLVEFIKTCIEYGNLQNKG